MKSELTTSNDVRLLLVTPGSFIMGSPPDDWLSGQSGTGKTTIAKLLTDRRD
jgi:hypothetical protein